MSDERRRSPTHARITHTDVSSTDPEATRVWCTEVLGWTFTIPVDGYHPFVDHERVHGGIRVTAPGEAPSSTPTVQVEDTCATYHRAIAAGAESINPPLTIMDGVCTALVRVPGGVVMGFSGPTGRPPRRPSTGPGAHRGPTAKDTASPQHAPG